MEIPIDKGNRNGDHEMIFQIAVKQQKRRIFILE